jgi:hypothetical protein
VFSSSIVAYSRRQRKEIMAITLCRRWFLHQFPFDKREKTDIFLNRHIVALFSPVERTPARAPAQPPFSSEVPG